MAQEGETYRLKKIKGVWYTVDKADRTSVVLKDSNNNQFIVSINTLNKEYTKEK